MVMLKNLTRLCLSALRFRPQTSAQIQSKAPPPQEEGFPTPPDPISCCGSGCQNCVWIEFADAVGRHVERVAAEHPNKDPDLMSQKNFELIKKEIDDNIEDPVLKAYVLMEVKARLQRQ